MIIYSITNKTNGKKYIGMTINSLTYRKNIHKQDWKLGRKEKYHIYKAFTKYGWDNFEWEVIETCSSKEELKLREKYWINEFNSYTGGYNMTLGGDYNPVLGKFGKLHHNAKQYEITFPDGATEIITGLRELCRKYDLHHQGFIYASKKSNHTYKGFKCKRIEEPSTTRAEARSY